MAVYTEKEAREAISYLINYCAENKITGLSGENDLLKFKFEVSSNVVQHYKNDNDEFVKQYLESVGLNVPNKTIGELK